jgi:hypothetical protein
MTNSNNTDEREFEEGAPGTQKGRKNDPLTEYSDKEAMTPAKIKAHEPTAVSGDPNDQTIASTGQTGTDNTTSGQQQQQQGGQQQGSSVEDKTSQTANTVKEGAESTFDKLKAGAKAIGKKVSDPDTSLGEEYNKEKTQ